MSVIWLDQMNIAAKLYTRKWQRCGQVKDISVHITLIFNFCNNKFREIVINNVFGKNLVCALVFDKICTMLMHCLLIFIFFYFRNTSQNEFNIQCWKYILFYTDFLIHHWHLHTRDTGCKYGYKYRMFQKISNKMSFNTSTQSVQCETLFPTSFSYAQGLVTLSGNVISFNFWKFKYTIILTISNSIHYNICFD